MCDRLLKSRIFNTKKSVLLLGPRQVGKSTLCRSMQPDLTIDLANEETFLNFSKDPRILQRELAALNGPRLVLIDEVQRIPQLLNTVQHIIDTKSSSSIKFLLTGSSARKLRKSGVNLLPGRVLMERMDPLTLCEIGEAFDLERSLRVGNLPGIYLDAEEGDDVLSSYVETYLREEIRQEALVRDLGGFARFLDVAALMSGQWLNYSKIGSDAEVPKETIRRYVSLLDDTLVGFRLQPFTLENSRRAIQRERLFIFDVGVRNAILGIHRRPLTADQRGSLFEQWVILQIVALQRALNKDWRLSSYRSESGVEVDLVIDTGELLLAIEIKAGRKATQSEFRGIHSLATAVGKKRRFIRWLMFQGERAQLFDDQSLAIPYSEALKKLAADDFS